MEMEGKMNRREGKEVNEMKRKGGGRWEKAARM